MGTLIHKQIAGIKMLVDLTEHRRRMDYFLYLQLQFYYQLRTYEEKMTALQIKKQRLKQKLVK